MNWRKILTVFAVIVAGILVYTLYLYLGPYRKVARENKHLRQEIEERQAAESKLGEELGAAKVELTRKTRQVEELQGELEGLRESVSKRKGEEELTQELDQVRGEYQQLEKEAEQLRQTIVTLEADKGAVTEGTSQLQKELQESKNRVRGLSQEVAAKEKDLEKAEQTHQILVESLKKEVNEKTERLSALEKEIESLKGESQQRVQGLQEQLAQGDQKIQNLEREAEQLRQTLSTSEAGKGAATEEASGLKGQLQESKTLLQTLSQEMAAKEKELEELKKKHQSLVRQLKEILKNVAE